MIFSRRFIFAVLLSFCININTSHALSEACAKGAGLISFSSLTCKAAFYLGEGEIDKERETTLKNGLLGGTPLLASIPMVSLIMAATSGSACQAVTIVNTYALSLASAGNNPLQWLIAFAVFRIMNSSSYTNAGKVSVCNSHTRNHPLPYTIDEIDRLLVRNSPFYTDNDIEATKESLCLQDGPSSDTGHVYWMPKNSCTRINGTLIEVFTHPDYDNILCARSMDTSPLHRNVQNAIIRIENDKIQNPEKITADDRARYFKSCRMIRYDNKSVRKNVLYGDIIDESCYNGVGDSRSDWHLTAPFVQCLQETFRNIIEKPISNNLMLTSYSLSYADLEIINGYEHDIMILDNLRRKVESSYGSYGISYYYYNYQDSVVYRTMKATMEKLKAVIVNKDANAANELTLTQYHDYKAGLNLYEYPFITPRSYENSETFLADIRQTSTSIQAISDMIDRLKTTLVNKNKNTADIESPTLFQKMQGALKAMIIMLVVFYVVMVGWNIIISRSIEDYTKMEKLLPLIIKLGLISYFALGDGWKSGYFNMIMRMNYGIAQIMITSMKIGGSYATPEFDYTKVRSELNFPESATCQDLGGSGDVFDNNGVKYCPRGDFIPKPQYNNIFMPYYYKNSRHQDVLANVICIDNQYPDEAKAIFIGGSVKYADVKTMKNGYKVLACSDYNGRKTYLAPGYSVAELKKIGIMSDDVINSNISYIKTFKDSSGNFSDESRVVVTAIFITEYDSTGDDVNIISATRDRNNSGVDILILNEARMNLASRIDNKRSYMNKLTRNYPVKRITDSVYRDMSYIGAFDAVDESIKKYLIIQSGSNVPELLKLSVQYFFVGFSGLLLFVAFIMMSVAIIMTFLKIAQNYIVGIVMLVTLVYVSPIVITLSLFKKTEKSFEKWKTSLLFYTIYPGITFVIAGVITKIYDFGLYGPEYETIKDGFFVNGKFDKNDAYCGQFRSDISKAPLMCVLASHYNQGALAGSFITLILFVVPIVGFIVAATWSLALWDFTGILLLKSIAFIFLLYAGMELVDQLETNLLKIFGGDEKMMKLDGGIGKITDTTKKIAVEAAKTAVKVGQAAGGAIEGGIETAQTGRDAARGKVDNSGGGGKSGGGKVAEELADATKSEEKDEGDENGDEGEVKNENEAKPDVT
jgi:hypothetical protein